MRPARNDCAVAESPCASDGSANAFAPPFFATPRWIVDPDFDLTFHVRMSHQRSQRLPKDSRRMESSGILWFSLTNVVRGWQSIKSGRMSLDELRSYYGAKPVSVTHPALLIRINKLYRHRIV